MNLLLKIVIFTIISLASSKSQHVSLIGSHQLPVASDYRVFLEAQGLTRDSIVNVTLQSDSEYGESKVFDNVNGDLSEDVGFTLPKNSKSSYRLSIVHRNTATNVCMRQSVIIRNTNICHMIIIQHDRPVYKNGETIKYRTFVLDRNMRPYKYSNMKVSILDGKQNVIKQLDNVQTTEYGVYEGYVRVAEAPNLGVWRIEVEVDGITRSKHFPVKLHNEKSFEVVIKSMDKEVPFEDNYVFLQIQAKSPVNKFFNGIAKISSSVRYDGKDDPVITKFIKNVTLPLDKGVLSLRIDNDLGIRSPSADMIATLTVEAFEDKTRQFETISIDVPLRMYRNKLKIERKEAFKPGLDFDMTIKAQDLNGNPDMSLRQLTMTVEYEEKNAGTRKETFVLNLKNGELDVVLHPAHTTLSIKVTLQFGDSELIEKIPKLDTQGIDEYIQATIQNKKPIYEPTETLQLTAQTSESLETLHVLVIGKGGLIYGESYSDAQGRESYKFTLALTEQMSPEAYIVTFYIRSADGAIILDYLAINVEQPDGNLLEITPEVQSSKPNEYVKLNINTSKGSLLYLTAVDQNVTLLSHDNKIPLSLVYSEVTSYIKQNVNDISNLDLSRISMFILQPLVSGVQCGDDEELKSNNWDDEEPNFDDIMSQKYFPGLWLDEAITIKIDEFQPIQRLVPNDLTSWLIYGTSMHPTNGLAVIKKEAVVYVFNGFAVKVHVPDSIRIGEVVNVEVSAFNYLKTSQSVQVEVNIINGDTMEEKTSTVGGRQCKTYVRRNKPSTAFTLQAAAHSLSSTQSVFVEPNMLGELEIEVRSTGANGAIDVVQKVIKVKDKRNLRKAVAKSALIDLDGKESKMRKIVRMNVPKGAEVVSVHAVFGGNLLTPELINADLFSDVPADYREPNTNDLMLFTIVGDYLKAIKEDIPIELTDRILTAYQETLKSIQNEDKKIQKSVLFHANAASALIMAKTFIDIDDRVIEIALDYLVTKQGPDGSFMDGPEGVDLGQMSSQRHILTAQFTLAFVKYQKYSNKYDDVITRAMKFLDTTKTQLTTDYEKVLVAYTFLANGDRQSAKLLTSSFICTFANSPDYFEENALYVEIASYLIEVKIANGEDPKLEVDWLLSQRKANGMFFSPHDTLLAMHALLTYEMSRNSDEINLRISIDGKDTVVTSRNEIKILELEKKNRYVLNVAGSGLGYAIIYYEYIEKENVEQNDFLIDLDVRNVEADLIKLTLNVKLVSSSIDTSGLVIVEVQMPSGYTYFDYTDAKHIKNFAYHNDKSTAVFSLEILDSSQLYKVVVQAVKVYQVEYAAQSVVKVYDYYRSNIRDEIQYNYDINMDSCNKIREFKKV